MHKKSAIDKEVLLVSNLQLFLFESHNIKEEMGF